MFEREDISGKREVSKKSLVNRKNILIALGSLVVLTLFVGLTYFMFGYPRNGTELNSQTSTSESTNQSSNSSRVEDSNNSRVEDEAPVFLFNNGGDILKLDFAVSEIQSELVATSNKTGMILPQYSKHKNKVFFMNNANVECFDVGSGQFSQNPIGLDRFVSTAQFRMSKSTNNELIYVSETNTPVKYNIHIFDFEDDIVTKIISTHKCGNNESLKIMDTSKDGSKLVYKCNHSKKIYLKDLNNSEAEDKFIVDSYLISSAFLSPDNRKLIHFANVEDKFFIIDIANPENALQIPLPDRYTPKSIAFSSDRRILFILVSNFSIYSFYEHKLITINYEMALNTPGQGSYEVCPIRSINYPENYI